MLYDATKGEDISRLARNLATTPSADWWKVVGHVHALGLMRAKGPIGWTLALAKRFKGYAGVLQAFHIMDQRFPETTKEFMLATIEHVVTGTDTENPKSFGGWSQREIDLFCTKMSFSNDKVQP